MVSHSISRYRILGKLGGGGLGEVSLDEDTHPDRNVALEVLPQEFLRREDRRRRFVQIASALVAAHIKKGRMRN